VTIATLPLLSLLIAGRYRSAMRRRRVASLLVAATLACSAVTAVQTVAAAPSALAAESPEDFRSPTTVDLLSRGAKPRSRLRLGSAAGSTAVGTVRHDIVVKEIVSGVEQPSAPVTLTADRRTTVTNVDREGVRTITFTYENASAPEINGFGGSYVVTDRGFEADRTLAYPPGTDADVQRALEALEARFSLLSTPFPYAAVGVGARWKVTRHRSTEDGVSTTSTVVYEIVEHDDNLVVLRAKLRRTAPQQPFRPAGLPEDAIATIQMDGEGAGDLDVDLDVVLPISASVLSRSRQVVQIEQGTTQNQFLDAVTTNVSIRSAPSGA
jgi:hypothetical protein